MVKNQERRLLPRLYFNSFSFTFPPNRKIPSSEEKGIWPIVFTFYKGLTRPFITTEGVALIVLTPAIGLLLKRHFLSQVLSTENFILSHPLVFSNTLTVAQDGTGDYTVIQTAVDDATAGDTIRVYPGTYYENIEVRKNLSIISNFEYTNDENDIHNTILDGNNNGSVIAIIGTNENNINIKNKNIGIPK